MADESTATIKATFTTREAADIAVERLVQEIGINRADVFVEAAGSENTAGTEQSGGDAANSPAEGSAMEPATNGAIMVSADVAASNLDAIRQALRETGASEVTSE